MREKQTAGAEARVIFQLLAARLKSCPDTKPGFSVACKARALFQPFMAPIKVGAVTRQAFSAA
jgi:hypothetical protein